MKKPNSLVIDLKSVREHAQAYVILSRVQALSQLYILDSLCPHKITACSKAVTELDRMMKNAINLIPFKKDLILSCNIRSFKKNFVDLLHDSCINFAQVICLQETWIEPNNSSLNVLEADGWNQYNVCLGRGKGVTTLFKESFNLKSEVRYECFQMVKISSDKMDVINVYRSSDANNSQFLTELLKLIKASKRTLIIGDFNLCYLNQKSHQVFVALESIEFHQLVEKPTHMEGRLIDLIFTN